MDGCILVIVLAQVLEYTFQLTVCVLVMSNNVVYVPHYLFIESSIVTVTYIYIYTRKPSYVTL